MKKGSTGTTYTFTQNYAFDSLNRVSGASDSGGWSQSFQYDRYGNPWATASTGLPPNTAMPTSNVYNMNNQSGSSGTQYDASGTGNQTVMGSATFTYDAESRIVQDYDSLKYTTTTFAYDGLGQRISKSFAGSTSYGYTYVYDAFGNLAAEYTTGAIPQPPCTTCYVTMDALGSARMVSDARTNGFAGFHDFAPFGSEVQASYAGRTSDWGSPGNGPDNLTARFTGAERDTETGLDNMQARYMASMEARFTRPDPAGNFVADPTNPQSWNMYSYAWNNPLAFIDPTGLFGDCPGGSVVNGQCVQAPPPDVDPCFVMYYGPCPYQGPVSNPPSPPPPPPGKPPKKPNVFVCASEFASKYSIAGALKAVGIGKSGVSGFIVNALGGNAFSGITDLVASFGGGEGGGNNVFYNMGQSALNGPTLGIPAIGPLSRFEGRSAVDVGTGAIAGGVFAAVTGAGQSLQTLGGVHSLASTSLTAAQFGTKAVAAKVILDASIYAAGAAACAAGLVHQ